MKKLLTLLVLSIIPFINKSQQCEINAFASVDTALCGKCFTLSAFGVGSFAFQEDFNSGSPQGWQFTQNVTIANNTCGIPSPDGSNFMWMGDASQNPRDMTTVDLDLTLGGTICFEMRYAVQGGASPCEGPDEPSEGVYVQYSTNNGATWVDIQYWDPNGGNDPQLTSWNQYCVTIPAAAQTTNTMIRWHQDAVTGPDYDHWGIDNVVVSLNDPNSVITWQHDNYTYPEGSGGGDNPTQACITQETTYVVSITTGANTCYDTVTVPVNYPTITVNAGIDTNVCESSCVDLSGSAFVVQSPAKTPTYVNAEQSEISGNPSIPPFINGDFSTDMNLNITTLNTNSIDTGQITRVCITGFDLTSLFGIGGISLANADIILSCPGGQSINLVNAGQLAGSSIQDMCFEVGGAAISSGSEPYTGTFEPAEPFTNLNGCDGNGLWNIEISGDHNALSFPPSGGVEGWSITFDDPEISYEAFYSWSPTTGLSGANSLNPSVCPDQTTTYTLTAVDSNNCFTVNDQVVVSVCDDIVPDIERPNIISINGDGKNDSFIIKRLENYPNTTLVIFNRWGKKVYENSNYQNDWKGTNNSGAEVSAGVYYYVLSNDTWKDAIKGNLTITK